MNLIAQEFTTTAVVNVNSAGKPVMNMASDNSRISLGSHFNPGYSVAVYIVVLVVTLQKK